MNSKSKIFLVVGSPGSGKDILIQAVNDMGSLHAKVIPKHTSRERQTDDGKEMICSNDKNFDLENCDITYTNYKTHYGIKSETLWEGLKKEVIQVIVISNVDAINKIISFFGENVISIFVHSQKSGENYKIEQEKLGLPKEYINERYLNFKKAWDIYFKNINLFKHVLIYSGSKEDLFDQIFRLFHYYEEK